MHFAACQCNTFVSFCFIYSNQYAKDGLTGIKYYVCANKAIPQAAISQKRSVSFHGVQCVLEKLWGNRTGRGQKADERCLKVTSLRNRNKSSKNLTLVLKPHQKSVLVKGWLWKSHPSGREESERKGWCMPNSTRTELKASDNRSRVAMNPNICFQYCTEEVRRELQWVSAAIYKT